MTDRAPSSPRTRRAEPRPVTLDLAAEALSYIPPDVERDAWVRAAMALKSEFGDAGFDVWAQWSAASEGYSATEARATWRSIQAAGRVKIGSLFALAKEHGFRFPKDGAAAPAPEPSPEAQAHAAARQRQREIEAAQYRERADRAARVAADMWASASETGQSAYLERKGVRGHGVRFLPDGTVLVPMRDAAGALQSLQRIAPAGSDAAAPEKRYLAGARKSGLFHLIGTLGDDAAVLLAAEGYATAASLHEATGRPVAVAFDAGNLAHVARALRALHPQRPILVCGDDDRQTQERTGKNPGREKALAAARAADAPGAPGRAVFPQGLPDGGTDFNDLAAHAGAEAVRSIVDRALADLAAPQPRQTGPAGRRALQAARRGQTAAQAPARPWGPLKAAAGTPLATMSRRRRGMRSRSMTMGCGTRRATAKATSSARSGCAHAWT